MAPARLTLKAGVVLPPCPTCARQGANNIKMERLVSSWIWNSMIYRHYICQFHHKKVIREAFVSYPRVEKPRIKIRENKIYD